MKIVSFSTRSKGERVGVLERKSDGSGLELCALTWNDLEGARSASLSYIEPDDPPTALDAVASGRNADDIRQSMKQTHAFYRRGEYTLHAPLKNPPRVFAIGL